MWYSRICCRIVRNQTIWSGEWRHTRVVTQTPVLTVEQLELVKEINVTKRTNAVKLYNRPRRPAHPSLGLPPPPWAGTSCAAEPLPAVELVLVPARHDLTQMTAADLFGIPQPTCSGIWRHLLPLVQEVTEMSRIGLSQGIQH